MTAVQSTVSRSPRPSSLADVLDLILDKGLVIDAYVRVSLVGIEILTIDARIVVASVDTYLHFAEAVNRLDLRPTETEGITGFLGGQDQDRGQNGSRDGQGSRGERSAIPAGSRERSRSAQRGDEERQSSGGLARRIADRGRRE